MEMCSLSGQVSNGTFLHFVGPLATLTGDIGKGLLKRNQIGYDEQSTHACN